MQQAQEGRGNVSAAIFGMLAAQLRAGMRGVVGGAGIEPATPSMSKVRSVRLNR
jgi:hypothetical protein